MYELQRCICRVKDDGLHEKCDNVKSSLPEKMQRVVKLASEKSSSIWLTVIPLKDMKHSVYILFYFYLLIIILLFNDSNCNIVNLM